MDVAKQPASAAFPAPGGVRTSRNTIRGVQAGVDLRLGHPHRLAQHPWSSGSLPFSASTNGVGSADAGIGVHSIIGRTASRKSASHPPGAAISLASEDDRSGVRRMKAPCNVTVEARSSPLAPPS
jgi:hypothetical protein